MKCPAKIVYVLRVRGSTDLRRGGGIKMSWETGATEGWFGKYHKSDYQKLSDAAATRSSGAPGVTSRKTGRKR